MSDRATQSPHDRLILALDVPSVADAEQLVRATEGSVGVYKVGLELALSGGLPFAADLAASGHGVFLDMKLLDIPNTVAGASRAAGRIGVRFLTVHAYPQAMAAAVAARPDGLSITAVTVLTSMDQDDVTAAGYAKSPEELVRERFVAASAAGVDAVVCSAAEAAAASKHGFTVITPGVRLEEDWPDDQKRVATPQDALADGADYIVVGRPITKHPKPRDAAARYAEAIADGLARRATAT